ncbi:MAG: hydroxymethylglutaryl-CoA lyase [Gammaproteobacteria bacterium]|jgi:hydroxymethylglutaryl-CoA lyase|nr:hydroxymethylglutaryl-CoA lyase [Gammaproteobacteria bacterium]
MANHTDQILSDVDVVISDCVLRDGLQILKNLVVPLVDKKATLRLLFESGIRNIEISSMVPPKLVPQFADAGDMIRYADELGVLVPTVLSPNLKGVERAIEFGARSVVLPLSVSETHSQKNIRKSRIESLQELARVRELIDKLPQTERPFLAAGISTAFGCSYEGKIDEDQVFWMVDECQKIGVDEIGLADTVGYAVPLQITSAFRRLQSVINPGIKIRAHFHDTFGLGLANAMAALEQNVKYFDASLCGLGGCPFAPNATGNITLEDLVFLMQKNGVKTGIDLDKLLTGQQLLRSILPDQQLHGVINRAGKYPADFSPENIFET